ncbi:MAG TPA: hypothetical protein VGP72_31555 [Planctomycetota bacterium]
MNDAIVRQITAQTQTLSEDEQRRVLAFAKRLAHKNPLGVPVEHFLRSRPDIPAHELKEMERVIEDGCEKIDSNGW